MWVKTTCCCCLCLLLIIRKSIYNILLVQTHTSTQASTCKRLQSSLVLQLLLEGSYNPLGSDLQKATTFFLPPGTTFHKFSDQMLLVHNNTHEGLVSSNFHTRPINNIEAQNQPSLQYNHQLHLRQLNHHSLDQPNSTNL